MNPPVSLTLTEDQHQALAAHLFPGDGLEAVAFLACGRAAGQKRHRLVVRHIKFISHERCKRSPVSVRWQAEDIETLLEEAELDGLSLVKVHSHPQGFPRFSKVDDASDRELLPTIRSWVEADVPHGSAIMMPDGRMFGRYIWNNGGLRDLSLINVVGPTLRFWWAECAENTEDLAFGESQDQAFGEGTTKQLRRLRIGIVGASGSGSPTLEQLMRLGAGHIALADRDFVEERNLNRITFATSDDAARKVKKVTAAEAYIKRVGLCDSVTIVPYDIEDARAIQAISECDVLFGCVDGVGGRFTMNLLASHYLLPYFDIGILLDAVQSGDERGTIKDIVGTVHYIVPGRSSLLTRDVFTLQDVAAEGLHKNDPVAAARQVDEKYIKGLKVSRPAVVSVNMFAAALAVNDFLARLHPFRKMPNSEVASIEFSLGELRLTTDEEMERCRVMGRYLGYGDRTPLLGLPQLGQLPADAKLEDG